MEDEVVMVEVVTTEEVVAAVVEVDWVAPWLLGRAEAAAAPMWVISTCTDGAAAGPRRGRTPADGGSSLLPCRLPGADALLCHDPYSVAYGCVSEHRRVVTDAAAASLVSGFLFIACGGMTGIISDNPDMSV